MGEQAEHYTSVIGPAGAAVVAKHSAVGSATVLSSAQGAGLCRSNSAVSAVGAQ